MKPCLKHRVLILFNEGSLKCDTLIFVSVSVIYSFKGNEYLEYSKTITNLNISCAFGLQEIKNKSCQKKIYFLCCNLLICGFENYEI